MPCPDCWRIIGEDYRCRQHGGGEGFSHIPNSVKTVPDYPPAEAMENFNHPWWDFLDEIETEVRGKKIRRVMEEAIP